MGKALRHRDNWQAASSVLAEQAERDLFKVLDRKFQGTNFRIRRKPQELKNIYTHIDLPSDVSARIYNPAVTWRHGIVPDFAIDNLFTHKTLYVDNKRQDGWVEGKPPKAGRGNVHERQCKFFAPGLLKEMRKKGNLEDDVLPFWIVLQGDIARDPKRVRELHCWYEGCTDHFFLWGDSTSEEDLIRHFELKLKHLLIV